MKYPAMNFKPESSKFITEFINKTTACKRRRQVWNKLKYLKASRVQLPSRAGPFSGAHSKTSDVWISTPKTTAGIFSVTLGKFL